MRRCPCSHLLSHACGTPNRVLETLTESKIQYRSPLATDRPPEASEAKRAGIAAVATRWLFEHGLLPAHFSLGMAYPGIRVRSTEFSLIVSLPPFDPHKTA